jgi:hypothetical protein
MAKVFKSLNRERTIFKVERKLMLVPVFGWWTVFSITSNLAAGITVGFVLYILCRIGTAVDPSIGSIFLIVSRLNSSCDPLNVQDDARPKDIAWL